jgi:hypothetical protein
MKSRRTTAKRKAATEPGTQAPAPPPAPARRVPPAALITAAVLVFAVLCQLPVLVDRFPGLDDSGYLFDGVRLVEQGTLMPLGSGPLSGIVNGAIYFFFPRDHMLLGAVSFLRRILLLVGILAAAGIIGRSIGGNWAAWGAMALVGVARPVTTALMVTADSLYSALAGLGFAVLIAGWIAERGEGKPFGTRRWIAVGVLLGLASLTRLDGLIVGLILVPAVWSVRGRNRAAAREAAALAGAFLAPVLLYVLVRGVATGGWDPQIGQRSYLAFEQGHNFLHTDRYEVVPSPSSADLYGSAAENGYSVLRAVARNPKAFLSRLPLVAANAARMFYDAYSILGGAMFLFLAAGGALALWNGGRRAVLGFSLLWMLPLAGYLLASYRPGFFGMLFPVLLAPAIAGAVPVVARGEALFKSEHAPMAVVWWLAAAAFLGAQLQYTGSRFRGWEAARRAEAEYRSWLVELESAVPRGDCLIAFDAASAVYSNHEVYGDWEIFYTVKDAGGLQAAMRAAGCRYLVVDDDLRALAPGFVATAEGALSPVYLSRDGTRLILKLSP